MDGHTKFLKIAELRRELHADGTTDERSLAILAEMRTIEASSKPKKARKPKAEKERFMTVLGGYKLDMHNHGALVRDVIDLRTGERFERSLAVDRY